MLFLAVVKDFDFIAKMKIQFKRGMIRYAVVSKAQNSATTALKWCDLGINRAILSQSDCSSCA